MKKYLFILFLLIPVIANAAPPTRQFTYDSGTIISSSEVTANEDAMFNYLQSGVDTYSDGTIVNADVNASANIQNDKLNLSSIGQDVSITVSGSFENDGATQLDGAVTIGDATADTIVFNADDWTLNNAVTVTGTWTDLGVVTTLDVNGGSIDGAIVGASSTAAITGTVIEAETSLAVTGAGDDGIVFTGVKDEDDMSSDSATHLATQQSIKAYADTKTIVFGGSTQDTGVFDVYFDVFGGSSSTTETSAGFLSPVTGTLKNLYCEKDGNGSTTWTVYKNGSSTLLNVTIAGSGTGNDTSDTVSVSAGDRITIRVNNSGSTQVSHHWGFEFDPA